MPNIHEKDNLTYIYNALPGNSKKKNHVPTRPYPFGKSIGRTDRCQLVTCLPIYFHLLIGFNCQ